MLTSHIIYSVGETLSDALDERLKTGEITQDLARKVIATFDRAIEKQLKLVTATLKIKVLTPHPLPVGGARWKTDVGTWDVG
jgi:polyhydroxyalkanoate synthesis regulator phasin